MVEMPKKLQFWSLEKLKPYERNSREHSPEQIKRIAESMKTFGFTNPILVDGDNGIIAGHGRLAAAKELGLDKVPVIQLEHLTDEQRRAYIIADNRLAELSTWNNEILKSELSDLQELGFDLELIGFDQEQLTEIMPPEKSEPLTDEDAVPEVEDASVVKRGDTWILGNHRLRCGDSTSAEDVALLMNGERADISFTSPPYNAGSLEISGNERTKKKYNSFDDNQTEEQFEQFILSNLSLLIQYSADVFYNIGLVENNKRVIINVQHKLRDKFKDIIYWKKTTVAPHIQPGVINNLVEFILCFGDGRRKFKNAQFKQGSYWNVIEGTSASRNEFSKIHKATFPIYLPQNIIENFCPKNGSVIDSFGGTGTTLIACEKTGRKCFMMELDEKYVQVIIRRWQEYTGKDAYNAETGETFNSLASK